MQVSPKPFVAEQGPQAAVVEAPKDRFVPGYFHAFAQENVDSYVMAIFVVLNSCSREDVASLAQSKRLVSIHYESELLKSIGMHASLLGIMDEKNVTEIGISSCEEIENGKSNLVKEEFAFGGIDNVRYQELEAQILNSIK